MSALALRAYSSVNLASRCANSDKRDLVIMMYDGAIDALRLARQHAARQERRATSAAVSRAITIIIGLRETLDAERGGSVATHLEDFYSFLMRRLIGIDSSAGEATLVECEDLLGQVREAWAAISDFTVGQVNHRMVTVLS